MIETCATRRMPPAAERVRPPAAARALAGSPALERAAGAEAAP